MFSENETVHNLNKDQFKYLLTLATKESYFLFGGELCQQVDGVAMASSLGPTLANIFLCHYEDIWLRNCSLECKPSYYKHCAVFLFLFESKTQVESFKNFMNICHPKMKFTFEKKKQNNCFNFLDLKVMIKFLPHRFYVNPLFVVFTHILIVTCH